jgi:RNA polymerase subunit RPABC4/transcription elongation factor Spt4
MTLTNEEFQELILSKSRKPGKPFKPRIEYNQDGKCLEIILSPDSYCSEWSPGGLNLFTSDLTDEHMGVLIENVDLLESQNIMFITHRVCPKCESENISYIFRLENKTFICHECSHIIKEKKEEPPCSSPEK